MGIGTTGNAAVNERMADCYGNWYDQPAQPGSWSYDAAVATASTVNGGAEIDGVGDGSMYAVGTWNTVEAEDNNIPGGGCIIADVTGDVDIPVQVRCAVPVNWRQTSIQDMGNGLLKSTYAFDSNTGRSQDIAGICTVGERVDYSQGSYPWPVPPFNGPSPQNPTIVDRVVNSELTTSDENGIGFGFSGPYREAQVTAVQVFRYKCPCSGSDYQQLGGPYAIIRTVSKNPNGTWKCVITKSNGQATINPLPQ